MQWSPLSKKQNATFGQFFHVQRPSEHVEINQAVPRPLCFWESVLELCLAKEYCAGLPNCSWESSLARGFPKKCNAKLGCYLFFSKSSLTYCFYFEIWGAVCLFSDRQISFDFTASTFWLWTYFSSWNRSQILKLKMVVLHFDFSGGGQTETCTWKAKMISSCTTRIKNFQVCPWEFKFQSSCPKHSNSSIFDTPSTIGIYHFFFRPMTLLRPIFFQVLSR